jgi:hypothetical protein
MKIAEKRFDSQMKVGLSQTKEAGELTERRSNNAPDRIAEREN